MHLFSGSMEPAFYRGDLLFLTNPVNEPYLVGDITVYKVSSRMHIMSTGYQDILDTRRGYSHRAPSYREPLQVGSSVHLHICAHAHA
jgi:signal peptidase I